MPAKPLRDEPPRRHLAVEYVPLDTLILDVTDRRDIVRDPFLGSGATCVAAERVGRLCRGIGMDPLYVDLAIRRWHRLTGEQAIRGDGAAFDTLSVEALGGEESNHD